MEKDTFILKANHYKMFRNRLTQEQKGHLLDAIFCDQLGESVESHTADPLVGMVFDMIQDFYQQCNEAYQEKCERNRENIRKRWNKQNDTENTTEYDSIQPNTSEKSVIHSESKSESDTESESKSKPKSKSDFSEKEKISLSEERQIFHLFFLNNFYNPQEELERFYSHYESLGWMVGGRKVKSKLSRARLWKPEDESDTHFTDSQMYFLHLLYSRCKTAEAKDVIVQTERIEEVLNGGYKEWVFYTQAKEGLAEALQKYTDVGDLPKGITNIRINQQ